MKLVDAVPCLFQALEDEDVDGARLCSEIITQERAEPPEIKLTAAQVRQVARFVERFLHLPQDE